MEFDQTLLLGQATLPFFFIVLPLSINFTPEILHYYDWLNSGGKKKKNFQAAGYLNLWAHLFRESLA